MKIFDGRYYQIEHLDGDNVSARCISCNTIRRGSMKSSGNFITHYRISHFSSLPKLLEYIKKPNSPAEQLMSLQPTISKMALALTDDEVGFRIGFVNIRINFTFLKLSNIFIGSLDHIEHRQFRC